MLQTNYSIFQHEDGELAVRTDSGKWSLPEHLHDHIDLISPTNSFFRPKAKRGVDGTVKPVKVFSSRARDLDQLEKMPSHPTVANACDSNNVTPLCIRTYYGTFDYIPQVPGKNKVALSNYLGESSNRSDVGIFLKSFRPDAVKGKC